MADRIAEIKAQGVQELARDPNSNVTSDDVQKVIVNESKKAGVPAFRFDPNTTPEEKAAQAKAAFPPGLKRDKTHGIGIVTDINTGPDQYDLPPPTASGAIAPTPVTPGSAGKPNGLMNRDEKETFEQKTGWAPRFGNGNLTEEEANVSLLDHQTFVESKLDEKFFGDWYHNAAVIIFACLSSWVVAILGGGLGWIFIIMAACSTYYRTSLRRVRRNIKDDIYREMAITKSNEGQESLEWMNSFLYRFWPIYAPILCQTIINSVDQVLSTSTPAFLESLRMKTFTLGTKPPRMEYVKTYPKDSDESLTMEWKFSFTPNDVSDMTARQKANKINPKIVLEVRIGKGIISKGLDVIVEDMAFSGIMKVHIKFQLPFPHIEKVDVCFMGRPDIDYVCKPLGGDTLGFDINFIPGLETFIKDQIHANLEPIMYHPHIFPVEIAKILAGSPVDQALGVVAVTLHGAQGLKNPDNFAGNPDAYIVASLNSRTPLGKTKTVKDTPNPRFGETIYVIVTSLTDTLTLQVFDWNEFRKDKDLGTASFALEQLELVTDVENSQLEVVASGNKKRGLIQADIRYFPVLEGLTLENGKKEPPPESNTGIARLTIEQAKDLDGSKSLVGQLNPYAELLLNGQVIHTTNKMKRTNQPIWTDNAKEFLVTDRKSARLAVVIKDERDLGSDAMLGSYQIKLEDMLKMMDQGKEWYNLAGATTGRVKLMLQWKPVGLRDVFGTSGGYMTPIGVMRLYFQNGKGLRNVEAMGKSDPYVRVLLSGIEKGRTVTHQNNLNPEFEEVIYVPVHSPREHLTVEVMDYQNIGKDRSLGMFELPAADYIHTGPNGEYLVHDEKRKIIAAPLKMLNKGTPKGILNFTAAFYPTIPTVDEGEEGTDEKAAGSAGINGHAKTDASSDLVGRVSSNTSTSNTSSTKKGTDSIEAGLAKSQSVVNNESGKINTSLPKELITAEKDAAKEANGDDVAEIPKIRLTADDLIKYETGLLVFRLISGEFSRTDHRLEVIMDDFLYPSFVSSKIKSRSTVFGETGDAIVREIDLSRITVRLVEKSDNDSSDEKHVLGKLAGELLPVLSRCLNTESELSIGSGADGGKVKVLMKYIPIKMQLDPSESMNNMGTLRVDVFDAKGLPAADKNGFSDPYCKFEINSETVHKTKTLKKTLNPSWGENFETPIKSRTASKFKVRVFDWDQFGDDDFLGEANINLEHLDPMMAKNVQLKLDGAKGPGSAGIINLRLLFKAAYVTRSRQGSSTFSGSMGNAGKVVGAPVKVVGKVGSGVGGGLAKGASFMKHGFKGSKDTNARESMDTNGNLRGTDAPIPSIETPQKSSALTGGDSPTPSPRAPSIGGMSVGGGPSPVAGDIGTASISVISATGYPSDTKIQVIVKAIGGKKSKELIKTKPLKNSGPDSNLAWEGEGIKHACAPDTQFQVVVEDHGLFGGKDLGDALFFIDDSAVGGSEKSVKVGSGTVVLKSGFTRSEGSIAGNTTAESLRTHRRSFLSRSRGSTPS